MGVQMRFRFFNGKEGVIAFSFGCQLFKFERFECQIKEICGPEACVRDTSLTTINEESERAQKAR